MPWLLSLILLLEGFITISIEVLTMRQLMPFYSGSVLITSIIIGVFLMFLALGYWRGGNHQTAYFERLSINFSLSLLWTGVGLSYLAIALFYYLSIYQIGLPFLFSLFIYLLIVLAPIVYWLGQTIPLTTNLFHREQRVSRISSRALFLSTIGSFLGALLTSLLLFHYLGVAKTVVLNCALMFLVVICLRTNSRLPLWKLGVLLVAMLFITKLNVDVERLQFKTTNNYANYQVMTTPEFTKLFQINESNSSQLTAKRKGFYYIEAIRDILFKQLQLHHQRMLVIGAGGFTLTALNTGDNDVLYVDIDPDIQRIAETHFLNEPIKGSFIGQDARGFLRESDERFDVIVSDVYSHQRSIPQSLLTQEYFHAIRDHLTARGLFIANVIANPLFADEYAQTVYNTIHSVFSYCAIVPLNWSMGIANVLYICPNQNAPRTVYKDDLNTATIDLFNSLERHRS